MVVIKPPNHPQEILNPHQTSRRMTPQARWFTLAIFAACLLAAAHQSRRQNGLLLRGTTPSNPSVAADTTAPKQAAWVKEVEAAIHAPPPPVPPPLPPKPAPPPPPPLPPLTPATAPRGPYTKLCQRTLGINLSDPSTWGTSYTPSYSAAQPSDSSEAILLIQDGPYGNTLILSLFHSLDLAYDKQCPVYALRSANYLWNTIRFWFYGERHPPDESFWNDMRQAWNLTVVDAASEIEKFQKDAAQVHKIGAQAGLYLRSSLLDANSMRNRRDTIFRTLFGRSRTEGDGNVCSKIAAWGLDAENAKYTFVDVPNPDPWNQKFNEMSGKDYTEAFEMKPEYVKSILGPLEMMSHPILLQRQSVDGAADLNRVQVQRLIDDAELKTQQEKEVTINDVHLAVLADVFLGSPASHWSLLIARMRYALGMKNTFVLTKWDEEKKGWVSSVDPLNYLELYDPKTMGLWLG